jgi:hypothetical protein
LQPFAAAQRLKDKTQFHVAEALDEHFSQQKPLCLGLIEPLNSSMLQFLMSVRAMDVYQNTHVQGSWVYIKTGLSRDGSKKLDAWDEL